MAEVKSVSTYIKAQLKKGVQGTELLEKLVSKFPNKDLVTLQSKLDKVESKYSKQDKPAKTKAKTKTKSKPKIKLPKKICYGLPETATEGFGWLSNMAPAVIYAKVGRKYSSDGYITFVSAEQAFQWYKCDDAKREVIANCVKAKDARYHGSERAGAKIRKGFEDIKEDIMYKILLSKYSQHAVLRKRLIETEDVPLFEVAPWDKQKFWGVDKDLKGKNTQAKLTEKVRKVLQKDPSLNFVTLDFT